jgi:hypothetical protein
VAKPPERDANFFRQPKSNRRKLNDIKGLPE